MPGPSSRNPFGHHGARIACQLAQQLELLGRQLQGLPASRGVVAPGLDDEVAERPAVAGLPCAAAQDSANAGNQFGRGKRLDDEVIGSTIQAAQAIIHRAASRDHDDGHPGVLGAPTRQQVEAAAIGQRQVQQHTVNERTVDAVRGVGSTAMPFARQPFDLQRGLKRVTQIQVVFDEEQVHGAIVARRA